MSQQFFSLGALIEPESLYTDSALTKKEIAALATVSRQTVVKWDKIAFLVAEYRQDYPLLGDAKFERDRTVPLSPYQVWVISRVGALMSKLKDAKRVISYVQTTPQFFSKARYQAKCSQIYKETAA